MSSENLHGQAKLEPLTTIIIPVYNEEQILASASEHLLASLSDMRQDFEVLLCENGSTDATLEIANELSRRHTQVRVKSLVQANYGKALRAGLSDKHLGERIIVLNIDLVDMGFVEKAMEALEDYDIVLGSKTMTGAVDQRPITRRIITKTFNSLMKILFGLKASDTHGAKSFRKRAIAKLVSECRTQGEIFDTELVLRAERHGMRILEVPVTVEETRPTRYGLLKRVPNTVVDLYLLRRAVKSLDIRDKTMFYDSIASDFDSVMNKYELDKRIRIVFDLLSKEKMHGKLLLDAGCGTGWFSQKAEQLGARVVSVDVAGKVLREVRKKCSSSLIQCDICDTSFSDDSFDIVLASEVVEHTLSPKQAIAEMARVLKPGGVLVLTVPNRIWHFAVTIGNTLRVRPYAGLENWVRRSALKRWLAENNLHLELMLGFNIVPFFWKKLYRIIDFFDRSENILSPIMLNIGVRARKGRINPS